MSSLQERIAEGKRLAEERRAAMDPALRRQVEEMVAGIPDLLTRMFCSPPNEKGRQTMYEATPEELAEWKASHGQA